ncbi:sensor histidine kinase [Aquimarina intermedia]|uniref:histidine kinase n=1 Tax=Aquimarina intermedia TaxID=350814 RepID=A0A5S5C9A8_9FLAO|nr:GAF domain-containing sensor histidine kinase [Aquimarina intermedia]TYP74966.1 signal transduction histidine kinase [Aquimarina intermedia]
MLNPAKAVNEEARLHALHSYNILHTEKEAEYNEITDLAAEITGKPVAIISLVDQEEVWLKATSGMDICSSERKYSFCSHTILEENELLIVEDSNKDSRFSGNPYTEGETPIIFYAGVSLKDESGHALGTLCVIDHKPNTITKKQINSLQVLARQIMKLLTLRKSNEQLKKLQSELTQKNELLRGFAGIVSHDMKMPLANMILTTDVLRAKYGNHLDKKGISYLDNLKHSSFKLSDYVGNLLAYYESDGLSKGKPEEFELNHLLEEIVELLGIDHKVTINFPEENINLHCNRAALEQILLNLIGNSLKYNDKDEVVVTIGCKETKEAYYFEVSDNGIGIPEDKQHLIFDLFTTVAESDRKGNKGNGIGLSTVKKLIDSLGGEIKVASIENEETVFNFTVKK